MLSKRPFVNHLNRLRYTQPRVVQLFLALGLVALLLPAWKSFILTKQISYTATRVERRSRSYLAKDHDVLMPEQFLRFQWCKRWF